MVSIENDLRISLREARERTGLSREKVGARIGVSSRTIERWENPGQRPVRFKRYKLVQLAELYGVGIDELIEADRTTTNRARRAA